MIQTADALTPTKPPWTPIALTMLIHGGLHGTFAARKHYSVVFVQWADRKREFYIIAIVLTSSFARCWSGASNLKVGSLPWRHHRVWKLNYIEKCLSPVYLQRACTPQDIEVWIPVVFHPPCVAEKVSKLKRNGHAIATHGFHMMQLSSESVMKAAACAYAL